MGGRGKNIGFFFSKYIFINVVYFCFIVVFGGRGRYLVLFVFSGIVCWVEEGRIRWNLRCV